MPRKYSKSAQKKVGDVMKEYKKGTLKNGQSGKKVTNRKQAIAIGISEARESGKKVPPAKGGKGASSKGSNGRKKNTGGGKSSTGGNRKRSSAGSKRSQNTGEQSGGTKKSKRSTRKAR